MIDEVIAELDPRPGETVCDCTLGGAGHTLEMARRIQPDGLSLGIDQDDMALDAASARFERELPTARRRFLKGNFDSLDDLLVQAEVPGVDCFLFDIGVSSPQLDIPERGFSYHEDAPLDMRMGPGDNTLTAAEVTNSYNEADLARILRVYGDERNATRIARQIVRTREKAPIETTLQLVEVIKAAIPAAGRRHGGHPARKTFQALRIEVNHEMDVLRALLEGALRVLKPGGRLSILTYHSLEDRMVKNFMRAGNIEGKVEQDFYGNRLAPMKPVNNKVIVPSAEEQAQNPRSRSAKLRVAEKCETVQGRPQHER